jgi:hypothetical protein
VAGCGGDLPAYRTSRSHYCETETREVCG